MELIVNKKFDEERALYNIKNAEIKKCKFKGEKDGESSLKEARNIKVDECSFCLRYPLWHVHKFSIINSKFDKYSRAPIWYSKDGELKNIEMNSIKAIRECKNIKINSSKILSMEFGWKSSNLDISDSILEGEYAFLDSKKINLKNVDFKGKYSFQYVKDLTIENSNLDTKDAFWHSENVLIKDTILKGEYLAWYSKNITLVNCKIIGTQPFCYCDNLKLINCELIDADLAFEYSIVNASFKGFNSSIKNPKAGIINTNKEVEIINEQSIIKSTCQIIKNLK